MEDWLTDIETASELMGESRTKLAQAKSRGLVRTLISEALTLHKTWQGVKGSLHLKICNSDIHTSISHFMDIQQKEKKSLAAYVHHFKWEASRCKFDNDAATIRFFYKRAKNAHTLATKVYEKGPQSLADAIWEDEKLQAAQQLTSTLLPQSLVNTMSSDDAKSFQCQETGHMACYCPTYDVLTVIIMAMSQWTAPTKFQPQAYQHNAETIKLIDVIDQHLRVTITIGITTLTIEIGTGSTDLNLAPTILDIGVTVAVTLTEVTLDPFTNPHTTAHHATEAQAHTITDETCDTADPHHAGVSPEITVAPGHAHPANTITKPQKDHLSAQIKHPGIPRTGNTSKSPLMTCPQSTIALMNRTAIQRMI